MISMCLRSFFLTVILLSCYLYTTFIHGAALNVASTCSPSPAGPAGSLRIAHRYGPCSPLTQKNSPTSNNKNPTNDQDQQQSAARLPVVNHKLSRGNFVVTVGLGTPKRDFTLIFDTGSGTTWIQCKPCSVNCKNELIYYPSISSTFSNITTPFKIQYKDKSFSEGYYVRDTLTLTPSYVFPNFVFGCSQHKDGFDAAGLLGVGPDSDSHSLTSQTQKTFGAIFCYCLPATPTSTGYLLFVITSLPPSVYSKLRSAFIASMSQYPQADPVPPALDTCYNLKKYQNVTIPSMVLHFANSVDINLDSSAVVWKESDSQVCLGFGANDGETDEPIIVGHHQLKMKVLYNIPDMKVGFGTGDCG
ncbi:Aspartic protease [Melia azedarach]|uniref:Aspartic protease n=1 Tax=Melia azedarach TaxID=155640 RepID=A0ACC1X8P9_MELAZ|nr:Aspartic protease [Melia azedarach]